MSVTEQVCHDLGVFSGGDTMMMSWVGCLCNACSEDHSVCHLISSLSRVNCSVRKEVPVECWETDASHKILWFVTRGRSSCSCHSLQLATVNVSHKYPKLVYC